MSIQRTSHERIYSICKNKSAGTVRIVKDTSSSLTCFSPGAACGFALQLSKSTAEHQGMSKHTKKHTEIAEERSVHPLQRFFLFCFVF